MTNGRGWHNEPVRHGLAARGIRTSFKARGVSSTDSIHDRIWNMARKNTGSHFLDSGGAYGYIYNTPIAEEGMFQFSDEIRYVISTPHWLENILEITPESEKLNKMLQKVIDEGDNTSYLADEDEFLNNLRKEGHDVKVHWQDNTYNHDNDFNQDFQFTIFSVDGGRKEDWMYDTDNVFIAVQTHNGCDVRGGYPGPQIFKIINPEYFYDWNVKYYGQCDVDTAQTKLGGGHLQPQYVDYEDFYDYERDFEQRFKDTSPWSVDDIEKFVSKEGAIMCPKCGKVHIHPYNSVIDGW